MLLKPWWTIRELGPCPILKVVSMPSSLRTTSVDKTGLLLFIKELWKAKRKQITSHCFPPQFFHQCVSWWTSIKWWGLTYQEQSRKQIQDLPCCRDHQCLRVAHNGRVWLYSWTQCSFQKFWLGTSISKPTCHSKCHCT